MSTADLPPQLRFDRPYVERYLRNYPLAKVIRSVLHDADRIPEGGCLLVGNHGPLAIDTGMLIHSIFRDTGRIVRALGDRFMFANPVGRSMARAVAGVEGSPDHAHALLMHGDAVLVYPGGARETTRDPSQRYTLHWEGRLGFARVALDAQRPVVPVACIGSDDLLTQVVDRDTVRNSFAGKLFSSFLKPESIPPLYMPKLRATQFHYFFGAPIAPPAATSEDDAAVRAYQLEVKTALEALIATGLAIRRERRQAKQALRAEYSAL
jgi:1-acyl-sn-glycerol-3-phosphate acyltransferase